MERRFRKLSIKQREVRGGLEGGARPGKEWGVRREKRPGRALEDGGINGSGLGVAGRTREGDLQDAREAADQPGVGLHSSQGWKRAVNCVKCP